MTLNNHETKFTFADLFAGVGGMRIAFEEVGGTCVLTSEIDANALKTYSLNFRDPTGHVFVADVNKIEKSDFPSEAKLDILVAGFPCQPYSIAGLRKGLDDDRGGEIFTSLLRILETAKPRSFLLENVKGIRSHDGGQTFAYMLERLRSSGYHLTFETLNSVTHANIPQNRERVFIVGFLEASQAEAFEFPQQVPLTREVSDLLEADVDSKYYYDSRYSIFPELKAQVTSQDTVYQWRRQYVRENKAGVCPTLTANMGSGGHNVPLILDAKGIRKLTPRETARLQGFPDDFALPRLSDSHLYHQFGNSVTVPLIRSLADSIVRALKIGGQVDIDQKLGELQNSR